MNSQLVMAAPVEKKKSNCPLTLLEINQLLELAD